MMQLPGPDTETKLDACKYGLLDGRYYRILCLAAEHYWPVAYTDDLYIHDRQQCVDNPDVDMVFVLRDYGTHLWPVIKGDYQWAVNTILFHSGDHEMNLYGPGDARSKFFYVPAFGDSEEVTPQEAIQIMRSA